MKLTSRPGLYVGECVPFYFCPRSVMLYMLYCNNHPEITYKDGQEPIVHLVSNLQKAVDWAEKSGLQWAFTDSNAGSTYFNDFSDLQQLDQVDWDVVNADQWKGNQDKKQAEFLVEQRFPWELIEEIGVSSISYHKGIRGIITGKIHVPQITVRPEWYYFISCRRHSR